MMIYSTRQKKIAADRALLAERFPHCFSKINSAVKKPLKIHIVKDLAVAGLIDESGAPVSKRRIKNAVADYCYGPKYQIAILSSQVRIDLDGKPAGVITDSNREWASSQLVRFHPKWKEKLERVLKSKKEAA